MAAAERLRLTCGGHARFFRIGLILARPPSGAAAVKPHVLESLQNTYGTKAFVDRA
jgi:hypothetical protein